MLKSTARLIRALFDGERVLSLAVLVDGAPFAGLLPFVPLLVPVIAVFYRASLAVAKRWPVLAYVLFGKPQSPVY